MSAESWFIMAATASMLVVSIACPIVTWVSIMRGRASLERSMEGRLLDLDRLMRALEARLDRLERSGKTPSGKGEPALSPSLRVGAAALAWPLAVPKRQQARANREAGEDSTLIAVPNLAAVATDREAAATELRERYAAIWSLAATGSSPEVIARATGQPIGQIELILGLRRQIDGNRTTIPNAPHT